MMAQLGNATRLKRSDVNISLAATNDSVLNFHGYEEQGRYSGRPFMLREKEWNTTLGILKMKRPVSVDKYT